MGTVIKNGGDFLNHIKRTLDRCSQRWEFVRSPYLDIPIFNDRGAISGYQYAAAVVFEESRDIVAVRCIANAYCPAVWECSDQRLDGRYAERIQGLLRGHVRDDAGNMVPPSLEPTPC